MHAFDCIFVGLLLAACSCFAALSSLGARKEEEPEDLSARVYFNVTFWHLLVKRAANAAATAAAAALLFLVAWWLKQSLSMHCPLSLSLWAAGRQAAGQAGKGADRLAGWGIPCWFVAVRGTLTAWNVDSSRLAASSFMTPLALYVNQRMQPHHRLWAIALPSWETEDAAAAAAFGCVRNYF